MNKNYNVEVKLNNNIVIVPVTAIDEDDAGHEAIHILYPMISTYVDMEVTKITLISSEYFLNKDNVLTKVNN